MQTCRARMEEWTFHGFLWVPWCFWLCFDVLMRHVSQVLSNTGFSASQFCQDAFLVLCPFLLGPQVWQQVTCVTWTWQAMFLNFTLRCVKFGRTPRRGLQTAQKDSKRCNTTFIMVRVSLLQSTELSSHSLMETGNRPLKKKKHFGKDSSSGFRARCASNSWPVRSRDGTVVGSLWDWPTNKDVHWMQETARTILFFTATIQDLPTRVFVESFRNWTLIYYLAPKNLKLLVLYMMLWYCAPKNCFWMLWKMSCPHCSRRPIVKQPLFHLRWGCGHRLVEPQLCRKTVPTRFIRKFHVTSRSICFNHASTIFI